MIKLVPSLLSCDFSKLEEEIRKVEEGGCDALHLDVMDGHFVPNITFGPVIIEGIRKLTKLPLDAHLMIMFPEKWISAFSSCGSDWISFHIEATNEPEKVIELIKKNGKLCGIAINPPTKLEKILPFISLVDFVLVMTVNPGFGAQEFIPEPIEKIKELAKMNVVVEVDGGIKLHNVDEVIKAGAKIIVSGSGVFHTPDPKKTVQEFYKKFK